MSSDKHDDLQELPARQVQKQKREIQKKAVNELGFQSLSELAAKSDISESNISRIFGERIKLTDDKAYKLIEAVKQQNYTKGWDALQSASLLAEVLNYVRNHLACIDGREAQPEINDEDVKRWHDNYVEKLQRRQRDFDDNFDMIKTTPNVDENLRAILEFSKSWIMKHDFSYLSRVEPIFRRNQPFIISNMRQGMEQGLFGDIKNVFTEIRHIAHLCDAFDFVTQVSEWLLEHSFAYGDMCTYVKAKGTLAWTLTSSREEQNLYEAQNMTKHAWELLKNPEILNQIDSKNADVVATICELRLRIPVRLHMNGNQSLIREDFEFFKSESQRMMNRYQALHALDCRLEQRYQIPLQYQNGIYLYLQRKYEEARKEFENIAYCSNLIGWVRVEKGAYSWLATLTEEIGDIEACRKCLAKIDEKARPKRQAIRDKIMNRI
jgi:plasmid maintenance system antidote protein VapI